jgi:hypothetical protein
MQGLNMTYNPHTSKDFQRISTQFFTKRIKGIYTTKHLRQRLGKFYIIYLQTKLGTQGINDIFTNSTNFMDSKSQFSQNSYNKVPYQILKIKGQDHAKFSQEIIKKEHEITRKFHIHFYQFLTCQNVIRKKFQVPRIVAWDFTKFLEVL